MKSLEIHHHFTKNIASQITFLYLFYIVLFSAVFEK